MVSMIGSSLHGESHKAAWKRATKKIYKRAQISEYKRKDLFRLCHVGINSLDDHVTKDCFLDLDLFPRERKICADALLDIWVYVRKLQRHDAFIILSELATRNLVSLNSNSRGGAAISYAKASEIYVSHRDSMQDVALNGRPFDPKILSIQIGTAEENLYNDINFPELEALLLFFTSTEYVLPPFVKSMKKLKYLMVSNCATKKATVKGLDVLSSLTQLKCVRLERLISPSGHGKWAMEEVQKLEKLSLSLCEGFENISIFDDTSKIKYFNLDHSSDLEEFPLEICNMTSSALSLSITNCHLLQKLPHDFGNMRHVRVLRLSALPCLKELPVSIGELGQLEYLEISACDGLKELPKEIGKLKKLKEFDMRECSRLKTLPTTVCELSSLELVICDEKIEKQWLQLARNISLPELRIEIVEAHFNLDWLDD